MLVLDHYLEVFRLKPGALPGATALHQARASGAFTAAHDAFYEEARRRLGDKEGTRAMVEVLLAHRSLPAEAVIAGMERALRWALSTRRSSLVEARRSIGGAEAVALVPIDGALVPLRPPRTEPFSLRRSAGGDDMMTKMTDTAALAAIGAATRELRLPVVRNDAARLAEVAKRSQLSYLAYLAEVLSAEVDERAERRRHRRITEAHFPRLKRLAEFDLGAAPTHQPGDASRCSPAALSFQPASPSCCSVTRARESRTC